ncbi:MAG TPA: SCP2 sterol-binding domain-containing protein [Candidatus Binatus sp.]|uniref:SCP2 sterol-binding domain-containing protein n=1 Tax=Candidatus Binatus sp. TaxID=2811406 RepID=UPI002B46AC29|nr:SCP2 sterol-binding domain-containing protein [Candidatus Binatus sp.]HKN13832.1 SCP2 sterol-binding domain-containing protein [Candidatus Binatus sp.]
MPAIYTTEWYDALKKLLNENPEVDRNAPRGTINVLAKIVGDAHSPYLTDGEVRNFVVVLSDGKCIEYRQVEVAPPRKDFDFIFELPASVFEGVAAGLIDLIDAGLKGSIKITGDMRVLIRHAELVNVIYDVYAREIETTWPKGKPATVPQADAPTAH